MRLEAKVGVETCEEAEDTKECGLGKDGFGMRRTWNWCEGGGLGVWIFRL